MLMKRLQISPSVLVWWGGLAAVVSGMLGISGRLVAALHPDYSLPSLLSGDLAALSTVPIISFNLIVPALQLLLYVIGIMGVAALMSSYRYLDRATIVGLMIAGLSFVIVAGSAFYGLWELSVDGQLLGNPVVDTVRTVGAWTAAGGLFLIGVKVARIPESLGLLKILPLLLSFLMSPLALFFSVFILELLGLGVVGGNSRTGASVIVEVLPTLVALGWITLGYLLWSHSDGVPNAVSS